MNKKGFTLIEIIIYVAIIGGLLLALTSFILTISKSRNKSYAEQEVNANARLALSAITHKIKFSSGLNVASSTFSVHPGVLSLAMASSTVNPTVIALDGGGGRLTITEGSATAKFLTSNRVTVTRLVFTNLTGDANRGNVGVDINVAYASSSDPGYAFSISLQTAVSLRQ